jgi:hypothetical protein
VADFFMKINQIVLIPILILIGCFVFCRNSTSQEVTRTPVSLEKLDIIKGDISNWNPESALDVYVGDQLYEHIDGAASQYLEKGVIKTGYQRLIGPDNAIVEIYAFDFGSKAKALAMFEQKKIERANDTVKDLAYPDSVVIVSPVLGGVSSSAHFGNFHMELNVMGFSAQTSAIETLDFFLSFYKNRIISKLVD